MLKHVLSLIGIFFASLSMAQIPETKVKVGPEKIYSDETISIEITVFGPDYNVDSFPEIQGFVKENTTIAHGEVDIEDTKVQFHTITKVYRPEEAGEVLIPDLEIVVNEETIIIPSRQILIEGAEWHEIDFEVEDADFVVEVSKKSVYVGEGVKIRMSFFISEKNTQNWQFVDDRELSSQIERLSARLKPENSLESRRIINTITQRTQEVKGIRYLVYDIFEAVYYPLNNDPIKIPSLRLKMLAGDNNETVLTSKPQVVNVKELPKHPLKDKVPVGVLRLSEYMEKGNSKKTGESFNYRLTIRGQANMNAVNFDRQERSKNLDFFDTDVNVRQYAGNLNGEKVFNYKILPKIAGEYNIGNYYSLIYFNILSNQYDTLRSGITLEVYGDSVFTQDIVPLDIYDNIEGLSSTHQEFDYRDFLKITANAIWVLMIIGFIYIIRKK